MMPQSIRKYRASYLSRRQSVTSSEKRVLKQAVLKWRNEVRELAEALSGIRITAVKPNRTGRRIDVRARIGGRVASFSVCPFQGKANDWRTFDCLWQEVALIQLKRLEVEYFGPNGNIQRVKVAWAVAEEAKRLHLEATGSQNFFGKY